MTANDKKHSKITTETNVVLYSLIKKNISQLLPKSVIQADSLMGFGEV